MATTARGAIARRSTQTALPAAALPLASPLLWPCRRPNGAQGSLGETIRGDSATNERLLVYTAASRLCAHSCPSPSGRAVCMWLRVHCPRSPLALPYPLTPPPIAPPLDCWQCVCMEAQLMPPEASFAPSNLPPGDSQCITQAHAPRPLCHAFECSTVGVHAYKVAVPVFHFLSHARALIRARLAVRRPAFKGYPFSAGKATIVASIFSKAVTFERHTIKQGKLYVCIACGLHLC